MAKTPKPDPRAEGYQALGASLRRLILEVSRTQPAEDLEVAIGKAVDQALRSGLKAALPGRQTNKQARDLHLEAAEKFRRAMVSQANKLADPTDHHPEAVT